MPVYMASPVQVYDFYMACVCSYKMSWSADKQMVVPVVSFMMSMLHGFCSTSGCRAPAYRHALTLCRGGLGGGAGMHA